MFSGAYDLKYARDHDMDVVGEAFCDFSIEGSNLSGADFRGINLFGVTFDNCDLSDSKFDHSYIDDCNFIDCVMDGVSFIEVAGGDMSISESEIINLDLNDANMDDVTIIDSDGDVDFEGVTISDLFIKGCTIPFSTMKKAVFGHLRIVDSDISDLCLIGISCDISAYLRECVITETEVCRINNLIKMRECVSSPFAPRVGACYKKTHTLGSATSYRKGNSYNDLGSIYKNVNKNAVLYCSNLEEIKEIR